MSRKRRLSPDGIHDDFFGVLFRAWPQCVVSRHGADRAILSPPHPKAAIQIAVAAHSAWLKGANEQSLVFHCLDEIYGENGLASFPPLGTSCRLDKCRGDRHSTIPGGLI